MKNSLQFLLPCLSVLMLSGCAQLVTKNYSPQRSGVVKYSTAWFLGDKNRAKAIEEMNQFCGSTRAQILREDSKIESTGQTRTSGRTSGNKFSSTSTQSREGFVYLHFKCGRGMRTAQK